MMRARLTFARFMEEALYGPGGYYRQAAHPAGRPHGYLTSPAVHPLFGALLGRQVEEVWRRLGSPEPFWVVEAGCGSGLLARDTCTWVQESGQREFAHALRYVALDRASSFDLLRPRVPSPILGEGQGEGPMPVRGAGLPFRPFTGCILANELWDNLPVHRLRRRGGLVREVYVVAGANVWQEVEDEPSPEAWAALAEAETEPTAGEVEVRPALGIWLRQAAAALERGLVLSIDFGYWPGGAGGAGRTLAVYAGHTVGGDPYAETGRADITAGVDLAAAVRHAKAAGLAPLGLTSQAAFLERLGLPAALEVLAKHGLGPGGLLANRAALRDLVRPDGLGSHFVLALGKGFAGAPLAGFGGRGPQADPPEEWAGSLPLLDQDRLNVVEARYPHRALEVGELWGGGEEACGVPAGSASMAGGPDPWRPPPPEAIMEGREARPWTHGRRGRMAVEVRYRVPGGALQVPRLEPGDRLTRPEFERRYEATPHLRKAELIEGVVYVPTPVRDDSHGEPHASVLTWLGAYRAASPGVILSAESTVRLDLDNEVQPDALLRLDTALGGRCRLTDDDYLEGPPELIVEVASSGGSYDLHDKLRVYRRTGVQEYVVWRVLEGQIDWFLLEAGDYVRLQPDADGILRSCVFPGLWLALEALLAGGLAAVLERVQEGLTSPEHAAFVERNRAAAPPPPPS